MTSFSDFLEVKKNVLQLSILTVGQVITIVDDRLEE